MVGEEETLKIDNDSPETSHMQLHSKPSSAIISHMQLHSLKVIECHLNLTIDLVIRVDMT